MFTSLYALAYVVCVLSLVGWFYFKKEGKLTKPLSGIFGLSLMVYGLSVLWADAAIEYKLGVVFRDFIVLSVVGVLFQLLLRQPQRVAAIGIGALALVFLVFFTAKVRPTFQQRHAAYILDEQGELLVELKEGVRIEALNKVLQQFDLQQERAFQPLAADQTFLDNYFVINIPDRHEGRLAKITKALRKSGLVEWSEENEVISVAPLPGEKTPEVDKKYGINDPGLKQLWGFEAMEIDKLYNYLTINKIKPVRKALVAILDTGVDGQHEDLKANFKSFNNQYDSDPVGHGTHCAGIAGAVSNNGLGVASFSTDNTFVQISSIRVLNSMGSGTQRSIINGIIEAADKGADVISMSLGGPSDRNKQKAYGQAIEYATKKGAIVVAAAGNSNRNAKDFSPVNAPGIIGVSAVDQDLNKAVFSNTVDEIKMGVAAPGVNIYSTIPGKEKYASFNGTSMATPYVAGLIGMMKSIKPSLTTKEAYEILNRTGKNTKATNQTGKLIQPFEAIKKLVKN